MSPPTSIIQPIPSLDQGPTEQLKCFDEFGEVIKVLSFDPRWMEKKRGALPQPPPPTIKLQ